jgi:hypothetical protein
MGSQSSSNANVVAVATARAIIQSRKIAMRATVCRLPSRRNMAEAIWPKAYIERTRASRPAVKPGEKHDAGCLRLAAATPRTQARRDSLLEPDLDQGINDHRDREGPCQGNHPSDALRLPAGAPLALSGSLR